MVINYNKWKASEETVWGAEILKIKVGIIRGKLHDKNTVIIMLFILNFQDYG